MFALCFLAALAAALPDAAWRAELAAAARFAAQSRFSHAEAASRRALALAQAAGLPAHAAVSHNNLASLYHDREQFGLAEKHYRRALALWSAAPHAEGRLRTVNNLASLYLATGQPERAARLLPDVSSSAPTADTAAWLANLAACEFSRRHYREARAHYAQSLALLERLHLPVPAAVARLNLAVVAFAEGRRSPAQADAAAALNFFEANLGTGHPLTGQAHLSLAQMLADTPSQAEPHLRRALAIAEQTLGPDSPAAARALEAYAALLHRAKRKAEAKAMRRRAAEIRRLLLRHDLTRHTIDWAELAARPTR